MKVEITIEGTEKEIADLVVALQSQPIEEIKITPMIGKEALDKAIDTVISHPLAVNCF